MVESVCLYVTFGLRVGHQSRMVMFSSNFLELIGPDLRVASSDSKKGLTSGCDLAKDQYLD